MTIQGLTFEDAAISATLWSGVAGCNCGGAAGIQAYFSDTVGASVGIINNTLDDIQVASAGIQVYTCSATTSVAVDVFNNIVTRTTEAPLSLGPSRRGS